MKKLVLFLLMLSVATTTWAEEELFLEGISIFGTKKIAFLKLKGGKTIVKEGDRIAEWTVETIEPRSVLLKDKDGKTITVELHTNIPPLPPSMTTQVPNAAPPAMSGMQSTPVPANQGTTFQRPVVADQDVPPGHRKVRTPFGDFVVPEKPEAGMSPNTAAPVAGMQGMQPNNPAQPAANQATNSGAGQQKIIAPGNIPDDQIPPGSRKVSTPFGEFIVKDSK